MRKTLLYLLLCYVKLNYIKISNSISAIMVIYLILIVSYNKNLLILLTFLYSSFKKFISNGVKMKNLLFSLSCFKNEY